MRVADSLTRFLVRFVLLALVLELAAIRGAEPIAAAMLPLFKVELARLDDTFRIDRLSLARDGADRVIRVDVGLAHRLTLLGRTFYPDPRGTAMASTLIGNLTVPCVLLIAVACAWPGWSARGIRLRVLTLPPALVLLCVLVVPFILWGSLWGLILQAVDPQHFSPLLAWCDFLVNGGGYALALAGGAGIGELARRSSRR
jgi:hypothetical protein